MDAVWAAWQAWQKGSEPVSGICPASMGNRMEYTVRKIQPSEARVVAKNGLLYRGDKAVDLHEEADRLAVTMSPDCVHHSFWCAEQLVSHLVEVQKFAANDAEGLTCAFCGSHNYWVDSSGFFRIEDPKDFKRKVCCKRCYEGPIGKAHVAKYGFGEFRVKQPNTPSHP